MQEAKFRVGDLVLRKDGVGGIMQVTLVYPPDNTFDGYYYETMWHETGCSAADDIAEDLIELAEGDDDAD